MKLIKNINNNYAIAEDNGGNELIVYGRGIGFGKTPRILEDITKIEKSFYDVDESYISMINDLSNDVILLSSRIVDRARMILDFPIGCNIVFTLADHIDFAIRRQKKNIRVKLPILYEIQTTFEKEMEIGYYALDLIKKEMKVYLPKEEASYIALQFINAGERKESDQVIKDQDLIKRITTIIEKEYGITIKRNSFNYARFATHVRYLLKRGRRKHLLATSNFEMLDNLKENYQETYLCAKKVSSYINEKLDIELTDEEQLYLILHINRVIQEGVTEVK